MKSVFRWICFLILGGITNYLMQFLFCLPTIFYLVISSTCRPIKWYDAVLIILISIFSLFVTNIGKLYYRLIDAFKMDYYVSNIYLLIISIGPIIAVLFLGFKVVSNNFDCVWSIKGLICASLALPYHYGYLKISIFGLFSPKDTISLDHR